MRKVLSFLLATLLMIGSYGFVFAESKTAKQIKDVPSDVKGSEYETAVQVLMALDIVTGYPDGSYKPEDVVTRAEMATIIVRTLGLEDSSSYMSKSGFIDMDGHWADKYVAVISGKNIVKGYPDKTFKPNEKVSYVEAITMIIRALGYVDGCDDLIGNWPVNYVSLAEDLDIIDGIKDDNEKSDRGIVAKMIYNALDVANVSVSNNMEVNFRKDNKGVKITFLNKLDCYIEKDIKIEPDWVGDEKHTLIDLNKYIYAYVDVYRLDVDNDYSSTSKDKDPIIAIDEINSECVNGRLRHIGPNNVRQFLDANGDEYDINKVEGSTPVYLNGGVTTFGASEIILSDFFMTVYGELDKNDKDKFESISGIVASAPTGDYLVEEDDINDIKDAIEDGNGEVFECELPTVDNDGEELDYKNILILGDAAKFEDIKVDDVITVFSSAGKENKDKEYDRVTFIVTRKTKEITIENIDNTSEGKKVIDSNGNVYEITSEKGKIKVLTGALKLCNEKALITDFKIGNTYKVRFDALGFIYAADVIESTPDLYGIVVTFEKGGETRDPRVKLFTSKGNITTFDVNDSNDDDISEDILSYSDKEWQTDKFKKGSVVSYGLDNSGNIDEMEILIKNNETASEDEYSIKSERWDGTCLDSDVVIFDVSNNVTFTAIDNYEIGHDNSKWDIVKELQDDKKYTATYHINENDDIELMLIIKADITSEYFAANKIYEADDEGDKRFKVIGFIEGKEATKFTDSDDASSITDENQEAFVYVVGYHVSKISKADMVRTCASFEVDEGFQKNGNGTIFKYGFNHGIVTDTDGYGFDIKDEAGKDNSQTEGIYVGEFADDVVVYLQKYNDKEPKRIEVGETDDINRDDFVIHTFNKDGDIDMVFVVDENDYDDYVIFMEKIVDRK